MQRLPKAAEHCTSEGYHCLLWEATSSSQQHCLALPGQKSWFVLIVDLSDVSQLEQKQIRKTNALIIHLKRWEVTEW